MQYNYITIKLHSRDFPVFIILLWFKIKIMHYTPHQITVDPYSSLVGAPPNNQLLNRVVAIVFLCSAYYTVLWM